MQAGSQQRQVALPWIARLRWFAVVGQIVATALGVLWLGLVLPIGWIALLIAVTAMSNLFIQLRFRRDDPPDWLVPAIMLLDVYVFTVLLYFTGGANNPFSVLYAIHGAMAVVVLGGTWAWLTVAVAAACYGAVYYRHVPLTPPLPPVAADIGRWGSLVLVMVLIAYFVGRVMRSLRQREDELAETRDRARRNEHLASLTTLAAGAAHELGTPLSTIALVAKEMERGVDPASLVEDAGLIRREVERCSRILNRMRVDFIEDTQQQPSFETLGDLLEELQGDLPPDEAGRLQIETREPGDEVVSRSRVLRRAVGVLLRNAFDAAPSGSTVHLQFERTPNQLRFEVKDAGAGMTPEVLRRAGEPFFTTKSPGQGMGLGLFLVRLVAETYGGRFDLQSAPGKGTCSTLELPERSMHAEGNERGSTLHSDRG